ncbi:helix-turn-helix domain-containing protein [Aquabacterium sp.]|uniref:helix-turn-helix domain-containing protein n=1 Tax=Aquabacterium sp. TaxID=1872578 RepID=UPI004037E7A0
MKTAERLFGEEVKKVRALRGLTQEELARDADIHPTYVSQLERGLKSPSLNVILSLANALDTTAVELVGHVERHIKSPRR